MSEDMQSVTVPAHAVAALDSAQAALMLLGLRQGPFSAKIDFRWHGEGLVGALVECRLGPGRDSVMATVEVGLYQSPGAWVVTVVKVKLAEVEESFNFQELGLLVGQPLLARFEGLKVRAIGALLAAFGRHTNGPNFTGWLMKCLQNPARVAVLQVHSQSGYMVEVRTDEDRIFAQVFFQGSEPLVLSFADPRDTQLRGLVIFHCENGRSWQRYESTLASALGLIYAAKDEPIVESPAEEDALSKRLAFSAL